MNTKARKVSLFRNGRYQAVLLTKDLELPGDEAVIRNEGAKLIIEPVSTASLTGLLKTFAPLDEDFPTIDASRPEGVDFYMASYPLDTNTLSELIKSSQGPESQKSIDTDGALRFASPWYTASTLLPSGSST